jgi:osmotically-inducible protein OsmY
MLVVIVVVTFFFTARFAPKADKPVEAVKLSTQVRDTNIQKEIAQKLAELKSSSIQVTVQDGIATLAGQAASNADAAQAAAFALQASGVKAVTNNIKVDAAGKSSPDKSTQH